MDIFVMNHNFDRTAMVENFQSFIWTERYSDCGDFELVLPETQYNSNDFRPGQYLNLDRSDRLMIIKTVEKIRDSSDQDGIKVQGQSFESVFYDRATVMNLDGGPWRTVGTPGILIRTIVKNVCVDGNGISPSDVIPNLTADGSSPSSPGSSTRVEIPVENMHKSIKELADSDGFGFRILFDRNSKSLTFKAYKGTDRSRTSESHPLVFSPDYDNLTNTSFLRSVENYKTTAYVVHEDRNRIRVVNRPGSSSGNGMNRRVLVVDANDIEAPSPEELDQCGREALTEHNYISLYDGEVRFTDNMVYGENYHMGDLVELRDAYGNQTRSKVVEHIWTYDSDGLRSYTSFDREED